MPLSWGYHGYDDDGDDPATQFEALYEHNGCGIGGWDKCVAEGENHTKLVIDHGFDSWANCWSALKLSLKVSVQPS